MSLIWASVRFTKGKVVDTSVKRSGDIFNRAYIVSVNVEWCNWVGPNQYHNGISPDKRRWISIDNLMELKLLLGSWRVRSADVRPVHRTGPLRGPRSGLRWTSFSPTAQYSAISGGKPAPPTSINSVIVRGETSLPISWNGTIFGLDNWAAHIFIWFNWGRLGCPPTHWYGEIVGG